MPSPLLTETLAWAETLIGSRICVHDYQGVLWDLVGGRHRRHEHPHCVGAKAVGLRLCLEVDQEKVRKMLAAQPRLFWKSCHGACLEAVAPIRFRNRTVGALFAGPYKSHPIPRSLSPEMLSKPQPGPGYLKSTLSPLPENFSRQVELTLEMLSALIARELEGHLGGRPGESDRRFAISNYIENGFQNELTLAGLATRLGLSPSRASQLVRSLFRTTFPKLVLTRRLEYACHLLRVTALPIAQVAAYSGIPDPKYFDRVFTRAHRLSPRRYRSREGAKAPAV